MIKRLIPWFLLIVFSSALGLWTYNMFNVKDYLIKFDVNGGSKVASLSVKKDNKLKNLPITSKENCEFVGWFLEDELFDLTTPITKDLTLVAKWNLVNNQEYKLTFDSLGGEDVNPIFIRKDEILENYPTPIKIGFTFKGWYYHNK